jgi:hypothetical protein
MEAPQLLSLDAPERTIRYPLLCQSIVGHMNRELATPIYKHSKALDRLASRPLSEFLQASAAWRISREALVSIAPTRRRSIPACSDQI